MSASFRHFPLRAGAEVKINSPPGGGLWR